KTMVGEGDLIERGDGEHWVVIELIKSTPVGFPPDALIGNGETTLRINTAGLTSILSPVFEIGQEIRLPWGGRHATVVRDEGAQVMVSDERPRRYDGGEKFKRVFL